MNPLPFNQQQNPTDYYKKSMFQKVDTTNQPYFERPYITIPNNNQKSFAQFLYKTHLLAVILDIYVMLWKVQIEFLIVIFLWKKINII